MPLVAAADVVALLLAVSAVELGIVCSVVGGLSSPVLEQPTASDAVRTVARDKFVIRITGNFIR